jgi:hypothetical protein
MGANENSVPVAPESCSDLETDFPEERVQIVADPLIQTVELASFLVGEDAVAAEWRQQAGRKRRIDLFEELEEDQTDGIDLSDQSITTGARDFLDQPLVS